MDEGNITFDYGDRKVIVNADGTKSEVPSQPEQSVVVPDLEVNSKTNDHSDQEDSIANDITEDKELRKQVAELNHKIDQQKIPLHPDALSGVLGDIVKEILPETEADEINLLMTLITYIGNYLDSGAYFRIEGTRHPLCFYTAIIGATG